MVAQPLFGRVKIYQLFCLRHTIVIIFVCGTPISTIFVSNWICITSNFNPLISYIYFQALWCFAYQSLSLPLSLLLSFSPPQLCPTVPN